MDAETLRARHEAAVARYARQVGDDGSVPDGLLRELREIADEHADGVLGENLAATVEPAEAPQNAAEAPDESPAPVPARPSAARATARSRTRTRTR